MKKEFYIARVAFPTYQSHIYRAELTKSQADSIAAMLEKHLKERTIIGYDLRPPEKLEWVHALILSAQALKTELEDLIKLERRSSDE